MPREGTQSEPKICASLSSLMYYRTKKAADNSGTDIMIRNFELPIYISITSYLIFRLENHCLIMKSIIVFHFISTTLIISINWPNKLFLFFVCKCRPLLSHVTICWFCMCILERVPITIKNQCKSCSTYKAINYHSLRYLHFSSVYTAIYDFVLFKHVNLLFRQRDIGSYLLWERKNWRHLKL